VQDEAGPGLPKLQAASGRAACSSVQAVCAPMLTCARGHGHALQSSVQAVCAPMLTCARGHGHALQSSVICLRARWPCMAVSRLQEAAEPVPTGRPRHHREPRLRAVQGGRLRGSAHKVHRGHDHHWLPGVCVCACVCAIIGYQVGVCVCVCARACVCAHACALAHSCVGCSVAPESLCAS